MEETPEKTRSHPLKTAKALLLGAVLCIVLGCACFIGGRLSAGSGSETPRLDAVVLETQIRDISELASVTYTYTNMAQFESSNDFYGVKIPFTTKSFTSPMTAPSRPGVDLSQATVDRRAARSHHAAPAATCSHEIDEDSVEVFDEKTSIFNPFTVEDFSSSRRTRRRPWRKRRWARACWTRPRPRRKQGVRQLLSPALPEGTELEVSSVS